MQPPSLPSCPADPDPIGTEVATLRQRMHTALFMLRTFACELECERSSAVGAYLEALERGDTGACLRTRARIEDLFTEAANIGTTVALASVTLRYLEKNARRVQQDFDRLRVACRARGNWITRLLLGHDRAGNFAWASGYSEEDACKAIEAAKRRLDEKARKRMQACESWGPP